MGNTGIRSLDKTVQVTNEWLKDVQKALNLKSRDDAYVMTRTVLHALRDRLTVNEAANLGAQLPELLRGVYYEGWRPSGRPSRIRTKKQFLTKITQDLPRQADVVSVTKGVFNMLERRVSEGELNDIKNMLPKDFASLWQQEKQ